jgi:protein TonB
MTSSNYAYQTIDDIVFEGRNREYGAYLLRKLYTQNLWRGLVTAIAIFLLLLSIPLIATKLKPEEVIPPLVVPKSPELTIINVEIPEIPKVITPPPADVAPPVQTKAPTTQFTVPKITRETEKVTDVPEQNDLSKTNIGNKTADGDSNASPVLPTTSTGAVGGTGTVTEPTIFIVTDEMPEFPGGELAMQKFLARNIEFPELARRNGVEGMVILSFIVNQNGDISNIQVLKNLGGGAEAEAIRVLKKMPQWKPGKNNGIPVNVRFTLPIRFSLK